MNHWRPGKYATIHRLAITFNSSGQGLARMVFYSAITLIANEGIRNIRVDKHALNFKMRGLLSNLNFEEKGTITIEDPHGDLETIGFELFL